MDLTNICLIEDNTTEKSLFAHIADEKMKNKAPELICEHSERTLEYFSKLSKSRGLEEVLENLISKLEYNGIQLDGNIGRLIKEMFINTIYLHDIGKINPAFQYKKMNNDKVDFKNTSELSNTRHSILSAIIFIDIFMEKIKKLENREHKQILKTVLFAFAYIISKHHSHLNNLEEEDFYDKLESYHEDLIENESYIQYYKNKDRLLKLKLTGFKNLDFDKFSCFEFYVLNKLLYSSIVSCDYYATYYYDTLKEPEFNSIENIEAIMKIYKGTKIYKGIEEYKKDKNYFGSKSINSLRSELLLEAEKNLMKNIDKYNIFYLEAPTGSGKTNTSINLALDIVKQNPFYNKVSYIFPFNTLVEQTKEKFDEIFGSSNEDLKAVVINSITPIVTEAEKDEYNEDTIDYKKDYLNRLMIQYPVTLTTHINFFNYLFGTGREINIPLAHLCNSITIIDEIQSYRNNIWPEIIKFLNKFSKLLNMKIIIMSATLPKLDDLLTEEESYGFCNLINNTRRYYEDGLFKDRVRADFSMLSQGKIEVDRLLNKVTEVIEERKGARVLIEFISKKTARSFFKLLKDYYLDKKLIFEITGDDSNFQRNKILKIINEKDKQGNFIYKDIIVVATQVIEAGVDIDMDLGFKDISLLDGEEQFLGRINRSCERKNCEAYFFNMDVAGSIYRGDFRLQYDLMNEEYREFLINKDFYKFYKNCFKRLKERMNENTSKNIKVVEKEAVYLNFEKVQTIMQLIKDENYQLFLAYDLEDDKGNVLKGEEIWQQYKELIEDKGMDYSKRKIELSRIAEKMAYFTYNYLDYNNQFDKTPKLSSEFIGRIYYIENGTDYITDDLKFDREKYERDSKGLII